MQGLQGLIPMIIIFALMYFMLIRPAQKQRKNTQSMQNSLAKGNKVVTIGGLHGEIEAIDDSSVLIKVEDGSKLRFERAAIGKVLDGATATK
ncbi:MULTISPECIES: preprotein translocase subunit YajC [unclassified Rummeliibacillus]|uniref:preprotein translocase subunit YajC n=1 Tax=unclassified Rummeliibacillus TaxID=2622809 RepID=UPI000E667BE9|nr:MULTISPECIES: preprotein translocase subunit YajC [unclassified Rummeliibacillus]RIJ64181.1 preprotein translocase subunit YajC [Rummeliibacillus sp. POC4]RPJ97377.1 preprotein translocase subunit YajC [Rummeliibacillus sp. TYF005]